MDKKRIDPLVRTRYLKKLWNPPKVNRKIRAVKFGVFSEREIDQLSSVQITEQRLYNQDLEPNDNSPLDLRLGFPSGKGREKCKTCNQSPEYCIGHFGHIDLVLPCFHIGYFKDVISILSLICKSCSRVLLSSNTSDPRQSIDFWRKRMRYFPVSFHFVQGFRG